MVTPGSASRISLWLGVAIVSLVLTPLLCVAQFETSTIVGTIHDDTGALIPGATVTVVNLATGIKATQATDGAGAYQAQNLHVGVYRVTASKAGFATAVAEHITTSVATTRRVDLSLKIGSAEQVVEVNGSDLTVETDTSQRGQIMTQQQIEAFPLQTLEYSDLVGLTTGVAPAPGGTAGSASLVRTGSFDVNGQRSMYNDFILTEAVMEINMS